MSVASSASQFAATIADRLEQAADPDAWHAAFCAALDETGDVGQSIDLADQATADASNAKALDANTRTELKALLRRKSA